MECENRPATVAETVSAIACAAVFSCSVEYVLDRIQQQACQWRCAIRLALETIEQTVLPLGLTLNIVPQPGPKPPQCGLLLPPDAVVPYRFLAASGTKAPSGLAPCHEFQRQAEKQQEICCAPVIL